MTLDVRTALVALLWGVLACGLTYGQAQKPRSAPDSAVEVPTVDFCELTKRPKRYVNKVVRVRANYIGWWESSYLYSDSCNQAKYKIHNALDCPGDGVCLDCTPGDNTCKELYEEVWGALAPHMRGSGKRYETFAAHRVSAVFIGHLIGPGGYGHLNGFRYEFRIKSVEQPTAIPDSAPW
jgi:hypothetical protein